MTSRPSLCIFHPGRALPHMLLGEGPAQAGGSEVQLSLIATSLAQRGWPVTVVTCDYGQPDEMLTDEGIRLLKSTKTGGGIPFLRLFTQTMPADRDAFHRADADMYVNMGIGMLTGLLAGLCRRHSRRFIFWIASITDPYASVMGKSRLPLHERRLALRGLREADTVIAQTREQAEAMRELHRRECPVIPNVWPTTATNGLKAEPPEVFWAARYLPLKRPEWVLEVARRLPDVRFRMAGGPVKGHEALYEGLRRAAADLPNVEVLGFVPFSEIDECYRRAGAYMCTSTIEGFPNTFLQAWNHRTPVVSTFDPDGVISTHGGGVACHGVDELAQGIEMACGSDGVEMGRRGRAYLEQVHSPQAVVPRLEQVLLAHTGQAP